MSFPVSIPLGPGDYRKTTTDRRYALGTRGYTEDGRIFRYASAGVAALAANKLMQSAVPVTNHVLQTPTAAAVGATAVTITTLGATALVADQYRDGTLTVDLVGNAGFGYDYAIGSHPANAGGVAFRVPLKENETVQVAIDTTANSVSLIQNPFGLVVVFATAYTQRAVGVTKAPIAAASYGWLQTGGPCQVLTAGTVIIAETVVGITTAGAIGPQGAGLAEVTQVIGTVMHVNVTTGYSLVYLQLD